ncbi:hypothetical protein SOVF_110720 isoform B [Spinacia oleracea]|uniref:Zinc finger HIT domain-containing protein 2 isoform X2 n=1 Tax=Spinacia oleracea TaxID=3562 RepID=A0A9R0IX03_SPIOL|nr:uncharacterized protein LOC110796425 isoform X2 [Spinacia oleracea]XP_021857195.1 uncharacterized protein LOC110796425 isoform X2 [Spinacia oleracea]KNA14074.1 hypothetical protein SOVF_110720 isoform B [Spinacia oleracea]
MSEAVFAIYLPSLQHQTHSLRCTESFMRENVVDGMRQLRPDDESKKKMLEILKRYHAEDEEDDMDEDEATLSEETIETVLSGGEINYDDLTAEEKKLFQRAIATGELSKMIEPWEPWWLKPSARTISLSHNGTQLIQPLTSGEEASGSNSDEKNLESEIPPGPETPLPPLKKLTSAEPSPLLAFHLVDILYSYCFTLRLYNGDWSSDAIGASTVVTTVSSVLGQSGQPESMLETVSYCLEQTCSPAFRHMGGLQFGFGVIDDVVSLISLGRAGLVCGLCDLQRMIEAGEMELKTEKSRKGTRLEVKSRLKSAGRKIYFLLCWVNEQDEEVWSSLSVVVQAEKASQLEYKGNERRRSEKKTNDENRALIEEV